jgi:hypothetical protein
MTLMAKPMTKQELRDRVEGWRMANARQRAETASMTPEEKLRQISRLMASASLFDMSRRKAGDDLARELWNRLRTLMHTDE